VRGPYRHLLLAAIEAAHRLGVRERDIVTASVCTSQSTTSILEKFETGSRPRRQSRHRSLRAPEMQIAVFFDSDGATIIDPDPVRFFEVPILGPLPDGLNYIP
jgi:hypothetical protein